MIVIPNRYFFSWFIYHHSMDQEQMDSHLTDGNSVDESHDATRTEADGGKLRASASGGDVDQIPRETVVSGNFTVAPDSSQALRSLLETRTRTITAKNTPRRASRWLLAALGEWTQTESWFLEADEVQHFGELEGLVLKMARWRILGPELFAGGDPLQPLARAAARIWDGWTEDYLRRTVRDVRQHMQYSWSENDWMWGYEHPVMELLESRVIAWNSRGTVDHRLETVLEAAIQALAWVAGREGRFTTSAWVVQLAALMSLKWVAEVAKEYSRDTPYWSHIFAAANVLSNRADLSSWRAGLVKDEHEGAVTKGVDILRLSGEEVPSEQPPGGEEGVKGRMNRASHEGAGAILSRKPGMTKPTLSVVDGTRKSLVDTPCTPEDDELEGVSTTSTHSTVGEQEGRIDAMDALDSVDPPNAMDGWTRAEWEILTQLSKTTQAAMIRRALRKAEGTDVELWRRRLASWMLADTTEFRAKERGRTEGDDDDESDEGLGAEDAWDRTARQLSASTTTSTTTLRAPRDQLRLPTYGLGVSTDVADMSTFVKRIERCVQLRTIHQADLQVRVALLLSEEAMATWDELWERKGMTPRRALEKMIAWERRSKEDGWQVAFEDVRIRTLPVKHFHTDWLELKRLATLLFPKSNILSELKRRVERAVRANHGDGSRRLWSDRVEEAVEKYGATLHLPTVWARFVDERNLEAVAATAQEPAPPRRLGNGSVTGASTKGAVASATTGHKERRRPMRCYNCGEMGHTARACSKPTACFKCCRPGHTTAECTSKERLCRVCHKPGHLAKECPQEASSGEGRGPLGRSA